MFSAMPTKANYVNNVPNYFLDDPYEGETFIWLMDLFGEWEDPNDRDKVWIGKRKKLVSVEYSTPKGPITVQKGWWFSAHETWKVMELPYNSVPIHKRIFDNGERARTINSALKKIPGLYAAASNVTSGGPVQSYVAAVGIAEIAFEAITDSNLITPYGSFPVLLANYTYGLVWYHNMLLGSKMQGPFGSTESCDVWGSQISPVLTWDTKITTMCALVGGVVDITEKGFKEDGKYQRFKTIIDTEWSRKFPTLHGEDLEFGLPTHPVPNILPDFTKCHHQ